jgi:hypothetical protein
MSFLFANQFFNRISSSGIAAQSLSALGPTCFNIFAMPRATSVTFLLLVMSFINSPAIRLMLFLKLLILLPSVSLKLSLQVTLLHLLMSLQQTLPTLFSNNATLPLLLVRLPFFPK